MAFVVEPIPDEDRLFRHVPKSQYVKTESGWRVSSACFKKQGEMSVNWEKYATAASTARENSAAVVSITAGQYRNLQQEVVHSPIEPEEEFGPNQAHVDVKGPKPPPTANLMVAFAVDAWVAAGY